MFQLAILIHGSKLFLPKVVSYQGQMNTQKKFGFCTFILEKWPFSKKNFETLSAKTTNFGMTDFDDFCTFTIQNSKIFQNPLRNLVYYHPSRSQQLRLKSSKNPKFLFFVKKKFRPIQLSFGTQDSMAKTSNNTKFQLIWSKNGRFMPKFRFRQNCVF